MKIKAIKLYENGFMTEPFAFAAMCTIPKLEIPQAAFLQVQHLKIFPKIGIVPGANRVKINLIRHKKRPACGAFFMAKS